jgi:hypothetical protein
VVPIVPGIVTILSNDRYSGILVCQCLPEARSRGGKFYVHPTNSNFVTWLLAYRRHAHGHTATEPQPTVRSLYKRRTRYSRYLSVLTHSEHTRLCLYATVLPSNHGYPAAINVAVPVDYIDARSKGSGPKRNLFGVQGKPRVIEELDNIVAFERDSVQRVQFWRESLDRIPAKRYYDERLRKLATAILQRSSELPLHTRLDELKMAAMECPQHNEVAKALRNEFRRVNRDGDEETFWRHVQSKSECRSFGPWPRVRLAEFYFSRRDDFTRRYHNKVLDCVVGINSNIHGDTEVWDAIGQAIPPKSVEFGLGWLRWSPDCERITEYLRSACVDPDRSYLGMWQELFVQSGGRVRQLPRLLLLL